MKTRFSQVSIEDIAQPMLLVLAEEDNSILEIGNQFIRTNYEEAVSNLARRYRKCRHICLGPMRLTDAFQLAGDGVRHSPERAGNLFNTAGQRGIKSLRRTLAFFRASIEPSRRIEYLNAANPDSRVTTYRRN